ncbi:MAG: hypothetical protein QGG50_03525 [Methanopyri archaeon]|jgi:hypothetical protein|nr:hypothetical protein [Methanopyri archaeon]
MRSLGALLLVFLLLAAVQAAEPVVRYSGNSFDDSLFTGETSVMEVRVTSTFDTGNAPAVNVILDAAESGGKLKLYRITSRAFTKRTIPCSDAAYNRHENMNVALTKGLNTFLYAIQPCENVLPGTYILSFKVDGTDVVQEINARVQSPLRVTLSTSSVRGGGDRTLSITISNRGIELLENVGVEFLSPAPGKITFVPTRIRLDENLPLKTSTKFEVTVNSTLDTPAIEYPLDVYVTYRTFETVMTVREPVPDKTLKVTQGNPPKLELAVRDPEDINEEDPSFITVLGQPFNVAFPLKNIGKGHANECTVELTMPHGVFTPTNVSLPYELRELVTEDVLSIDMGTITGGDERNVRVSLLPLLEDTTPQGSTEIDVKARCLNMAGTVIKGRDKELKVVLEYPTPVFELDVNVPDTVVEPESFITAKVSLKTLESQKCSIRVKWPIYLHYMDTLGRFQWSSNPEVNDTYEKTLRLKSSAEHRSTSDHDILVTASCKNSLNMTKSQERRIALQYVSPVGQQDIIVYGIVGLGVVLVVLIVLFQLSKKS